MKTPKTALSCAAGAFLAAAAVISPQGDDPSGKIASLEAEVKALSSKVEAFESFLSVQEKAGKELADALARSEAEGFTAGINPGSREILLSGLRAQAEAMQAGKAESDDEEPEGRRSRRGRRRGQ
ncbi:MAG: hypothetical protein AAGG01_12315 [Planctomycetota bacterium]